jgi:hypothetical protein
MLDPAWFRGTSASGDRGGVYGADCRRTTDRDCATGPAAGLRVGPALGEKRVRWRIWHDRFRPAAVLRPCDRIGDIWITRVGAAIMAAQDQIAPESGQRGRIGVPAAAGNAALAPGRLCTSEVGPQTATSPSADRPALAIAFVWPPVPKRTSPMPRTQSPVRSPAEDCRRSDRALPHKVWRGAS